jgi:hypothetical protein
LEIFWDAISTNMSPLNGAWFVAGLLHGLTQQQPV